MAACIQPARANASVQALADLLWSTDPVLNEYMFGSMPVAQKIIASEWPADQGLLSPKQAFTAMKCCCICLDLAAENEAVSFFKHTGFSVEIETRVPMLHDHHGIGAHLHMVRALSDLT